jgi:hypothetical protein
MPSQKSAGSKATLPMTVKNTGFLLDRLGEDCHRLQHLRELTTNSIEAMLRTDLKTGQIIWDVDWVTFELDVELQTLSCRQRDRHDWPGDGGIYQPAFIVGIYDS